MQTDTSRELILKRISTIRDKRGNWNLPSGTTEGAIYKPILPDAVSCFKTELESISGQCILCADEAELYQKLNHVLKEKTSTVVFCRDKFVSEKLASNGISYTNNECNFEAMQVGVTGCEFLIARTGSVVVTSHGDSGRQMNVFPPVHIVIAHTSQLVNLPEDGLNAIVKKYDNLLPSTITTITGPSRTADIEKTLVLGAHGPKELIVFLYGV